MFHILEYNITDTPYISTPVDDSLFKMKHVPEFFDRFGYELTYIESEIHKANKVDGHVLVPGSPTDAAACIQDWIIQIYEHPNLYLDHAHVNVRYAYKGALREQIEYHAKKNPRLYKLLNIQPKYMADFCLDYIVDGRVVELIHIEHDLQDYDQYMGHLKLMETLITTTDWVKAYNDLEHYFNEEYTTDEYAQAKTKAAYYGLDKLDYLHEPKMLSYKKVF